MPVRQYRIQPSTSLLRCLLLAPETCGHQRLQTDGELPIHKLLLRHIRHVATPWNIQQDFAGKWFLQPCNDFKQAAFAATVGSNNGSQTALGHRDIKCLRERLTGRTPGQVLAADHGASQFQKLSATAS